MSYILAALLGPIFWLVTLSIALWLVRKFAPSWEKTLWMRIPNDPPGKVRTSPPAQGHTGSEAQALPRDRAS